MILTNPEKRALLAVADGAYPQGPIGCLRRLEDVHGLVTRRAVTPGCTCATCREPGVSRDALCVYFRLTGAGQSMVRAVRRSTRSYRA